MKKPLLIRAAVGLVGLIGLAAVAIAQTIGVPLITASHPFADLIQVVPNGAPLAGNQYSTWAGVTNVYGYYKGGTGTQNQTYTWGTNTTFAQFANASAINTMYLYTPTAPNDGARACIFSIGGFTNITMYGSGTQTLNNGVTTLAANTGLCYLYSQSNTSWDRD
jgi:hypothetical protein